MIERTERELIDPDFDPRAESHRTEFEWLELFRQNCADITVDIDKAGYRIWARVNGAGGADTRIFSSPDPERTWIRHGALLEACVQFYENLRAFQLSLK